MPALDLSLLRGAGAETAGQKQGNHRTEIRDLYKLAVEFNSAYKVNYAEPEERAQIKRLDGIMEAAGRWLTSKPLKQADGTTSQAKADKNLSRWTALRQICEQCSNELIAMGYRPLSGQWLDDPLHPAGAHANYWLERLDPKHRGATALRGEYEKWVTLPATSPHHDKTFFEYVDGARKDLVQKVRYDKGTADTDASARRVRRRQLQVLIEGGALYRLTDTGDRGAVYDTADLKTEFAGSGFAIFVWDHKKRLYSGLHVANALHHSTARGGRPVRCAGELKTDSQGKLVMLTSKTGHYTTTPAEFRPFLAFLDTNGALGADTLCVPDTSSQAQGTWEAYRARDWISGRGAPIGKSVVLQRVPALETQQNSRNFLLRLKV